MDCVQARLILLLLRRDAHEVEAPERTALSGHLERCAVCQAWQEGEKRYEAEVATLMKSPTLPGGLKERLLGKVRASARPRPWLWLSATAAGLLTLALGVAAWWSWQPTTLDLARVNEQLQRKYADRDRLHAWLKDQGHDVLPDQLDFEYLNAYDMVEFQGRRVPRLTYFFPGDRAGARAVLAHVYVLRPDLFRLGPEWEYQHPSMGAHVIDVTHQRSFILVTVSSGGALTPMLNKRGV